MDQLLAQALVEALSEIHEDADGLVPTHRWMLDHTAFGRRLALLEQVEAAGRAWASEHSDRGSCTIVDCPTATRLRAALDAIEEAG